MINTNAFTAEIAAGYIVLGLAVLIALVGIITYKLSKPEDKDEDFTIGNILMAIMLSTFAAVLLAVGYTEKSVYNTAYETVLYEKIESLNRGSDIDGYFCLGTGYIDQHIAYYFYVDTDRGYELKQITAEDDHKVYLVEDSDQTPHVLKKKEVGQSYYIQIIIPEGTVEKSYEG